MSLPLYEIVPITARVVSPAFTTERKHMLLAIVSDLMPTSVSALEFSGSSASIGFKSYFGSVPEQTMVEKYFSFLSKRGNAPQKLVVANWYKENTAPFYKGSKVSLPFSGFGSGSLTINFNGDAFTFNVDLSGSLSYSDIASKLQAGVRGGTGEVYTNATVIYSSITGGFIVRGGVAGKENTCASFISDDFSMSLGLAQAELSQGVNAETYKDFCDRILFANTSGYSLTTIQDLSDDDIKDSVAWLNGMVGEQTISSYLKLVFALDDKDRAVSLQKAIAELSYTGYVVIYDPKNEYVQALNCAIGASIDYQLNEGAVNFNFQPAVGYTSITELGSVVDYQQGKTNSALINELNENNISCVYSLGVGTQSQTVYGFGLMAGAYGSEDIQINESALESDARTVVVNTLISLDKLKLQGTDADSDISVIIDPVFKKFQTAGAIARNGTLSTSDKATVSVSFDSSDAVSALENNGYYFKVMPRTQEDINNRTIQVLYAYIAAGVVNKLRINANIYGA